MFENIFGKRSKKTYNDFHLIFNTRLSEFLSYFLLKNLLLLLINLFFKLQKAFYKFIVIPKYLKNRLRKLDVCLLRFHLSKPFHEFKLDFILLFQFSRVGFLAKQSFLFRLHFIYISYGFDLVLQFLQFVNNRSRWHFSSYFLFLFITAL